jgi:RNA recognition motif-containing protein
MEQNIYVGNLNYRTTDEQLRLLFESYGEVTSVNVVRDRQSGRSRGFGFVEMASEEEADAAIAALNGHPLDGRQLRVDKAHPRKSGWVDASRLLDRGG